MKISKRDKYISLLFFLLGSTLMFFYKDYQLYKSKNLTTSIINSCMQAEALNKELYNKCDTKVNEVISCFSQPNCDTKESIYKFGVLDKEIDELQKEKDKAADNLLMLTDTYK